MLVNSYKGNHDKMGEYRESVRYKICVILSTYRRIGCLNAVEFSEKMRHLYSLYDGSKEYLFNEHFLTMVETGHIGLSESEVKLYARYIASAFGYDFENFYENLKAEASSLTLDDNDETKNRREILEVISLITLRINSDYKED